MNLHGPLPSVIGDLAELRELYGLQFPTILIFFPVKSYCFYSSNPVDLCAGMCKKISSQAPFQNLFPHFSIYRNCKLESSFDILAATPFSQLWLTFTSAKWKHIWPSIYLFIF